MIFGGDGRGGFVVPSSARRGRHRGVRAAARPGGADPADAVSQIDARIPRGHVLRRAVPTPWAAKGAVMRAVVEAAGDQPLDTTDGVRVVEDDGGWALVLPDPAEAVTHLWAEGPTTSPRRRCSTHWSEVVSPHRAEAGRAVLRRWDRMPTPAPPRPAEQPHRAELDAAAASTWSRARSTTGYARGCGAPRAGEPPRSRRRSGCWLPACSPWGCCSRRPSPRPATGRGSAAEARDALVAEVQQRADANEAAQRRARAGSAPPCSGTSVASSR